jgi:hypothetical protein
MLFTFQKANSQTSFIGNWEGIFMNDFKVEINFSANNQNQVEGNIKMFAGENIIQDDKIDSINLSVNQLTFYIPAKGTSFEGSFNDQMNELSGNFIFPDGATHAIQLKKQTEQTKPVDQYRKLKKQHFDADQLTSDLTFLYSSLEEYHPQLYTFTSKDSMNVMLEKLKSKMDTILTLDDYYLLASELTDLVHCSHTGVRLPDIYQNLAGKFGNYFPFRVFFYEGKAFFISGELEENNQILPGNEIISINNMSMDEIINKLFYFIPSEGYNISTKYNELNRKFNELYYYLDDSEKFTVKFKKGKSIDNLTVPSVSKEYLDSAFQISANNNIVYFDYLDNPEAGLLKISTFAINNMEEYFQRLDTIFNYLKTKNTQNLILDLRNNSGGHPIFAAQLLSYLTSKDFIYFKRNEDVKEFEPLYNTMKPNELNFSKNLYVFINGGCLSTTGHLISLLKYYTGAIFIGKEPGSTFRCNDFSIQLNLPNTGIKLNVPRTTFETAVDGFNIYEPFPIDYKVQTSISDIINNNDPNIEVFKTIN